MKSIIKTIQYDFRPLKNNPIPKRSIPEGIGLIKSKIAALDQLQPKLNLVK